ncbi:HGGxSTG domain-containing protein [Methylobacterium nonmethylotrophicum]|uniref:HGGxSTG domain-containing protein n=1 Tax=Methylobacterium nonmethylotrophicum TaxID=1141884 RepID=UPI0024783731|nr:HGGxSTG domain-containing protein [Methylobacterium nonmethylotrophicum]
MKSADAPQEACSCDRLRGAFAAPRCGARRRDGGSCLGPAMPNGRCRIHGGTSTGARTPEGRERAARANWKHGRYTARAIALRRMIAKAGRDLEEMIRAAEASMDNRQN